MIREMLSQQTTAPPKKGRHSVVRNEIVRSAIIFVEQHDSECPLVSELAAATSVSERTLRVAFQECFGMGPLRYLKLRTLDQVHAALQNADFSLTTVTRIAMQFGIWELGRFARDYRLRFAELPSETLRRQPGRVPSPDALTGTPYLGGLVQMRPANLTGDQERWADQAL